MSEKKMLNKFEILLGVIFLGIAGYICANKFGLSPMKKTETVEVINRPNSSKYVKKKTKTKTRDRSIEEKKRADQVEEMLKKLSKQSSGDNEVNQFANLSPDETKFHKEISEENEWSTELKDNKDWFNRLRKAHTTYSKVKNILSDPNTQEAEPNSLMQDVGEMMDNEIIANSIYNRLEEMFEIPKDKSEQFAKGGKKAVSDWAKFVEENKDQ